MPFCDLGTKFSSNFVRVPMKLIIEYKDLIYMSYIRPPTVAIIVLVSTKVNYSANSVLKFNRLFALQSYVQTAQISLS